MAKIKNSSLKVLDEFPVSSSELKPGELALHPDSHTYHFMTPVGLLLELPEGRFMKSADGVLSTPVGMQAHGVVDGEEVAWAGTIHEGEIVTFE